MARIWCVRVSATELTGMYVLGKSVHCHQINMSVAFSFFLFSFFTCFHGFVIFGIVDVVVVVVVISMVSKLIFYLIIIYVPYSTDWIIVQRIKSAYFAKLKYFAPNNDDECNWFVHWKKKACLFFSGLNELASREFRSFSLTNDYF